MLNDETTTEFAEALASRVTTEAPADDQARIKAAYLLALNREPRADETARMMRFLSVQRDSRRSREWQAVSRVILNLDEFVTRP